MNHGMEDLSVTSILTFGDSQAEVFDYVFHGDARYIKDTPFVGWYSGWSARDLLQSTHKAHLNAVKEQLQLVDRTVVFLAFGSADIERDIALHQHLQAGPIDVAQFVHEMVDGLMSFVAQLQNLGSQMGKAVHPVVCFPSAPLPLAEDYAQRTAAWPAKIASRQQRMRLWKQFTNTIEQQAAGVEIPVLNMTPMIESYGPEVFMRQSAESHQPDFLKTQHMIADLVCDLGLEDVSPEPTLTALEPHVRRPVPTYMPAEPQVAFAAPVGEAANIKPQLVGPPMATNVVVVSCIADVSVA